VINTIAEHAPNIKELIIDRQVLTPLDLERDFGLSEGNIFQGELTLEQLFFLRPLPVGPISNTNQESLHVRISNASRRRNNGRPGPQCRATDD
jgi:phytoene dehydrogenase-like protein